MDRLNSAQIRYLREVLGVEQILWRRPDLAKAAPPGDVTGEKTPRMAVFVEALEPAQKELLYKMLQAMKLEAGDYQVFESPTAETYAETLSHQVPVVSLIFGKNIAAQLNINFENRGKFIDQMGVATVVTYGPVELSQKPQLKAEAWKDMKLALGRLT